MPAASSHEDSHEYLVTTEKIEPEIHIFHFQIVWRENNNCSITICGNSHKN